MGLQKNDASGGMKEKVEKSLLIATYAPVHIVNGRNSNSIIHALERKSIGILIENE